MLIRTLATTAVDGDMRDSANRELCAKRIGVPAERFVWLKQVHSADVAVVDALWPESDGPLVVPETDGVVTNLPGVVLSILTADCVPVVAHDERAGVVGAAHAGRRGAQDGVVRELVAKMVGLGAEPSRIEAFLGPCASGAHYEVPAQMREEVEADLPGSACVTERGTPGLDLRAGLARQLRGLGVEKVESSGVCTIGEAAHFSHRRGDPWRFATLIWMSDEPQG
ncbi:MAG: peptidoglycan editing factor PgeF [Segniliparus sp.]|uniref:peptidoglycan editing factor PgeF n=1 Tax=Segniliparus sp. TaxID=2804064 RepID=UPI003F3CCA04